MYLIVPSKIVAYNFISERLVDQVFILRLLMCLLDPKKPKASKIKDFLTPAARYLDLNSF